MKLVIFIASLLFLGGNPTGIKVVYQKNEKKEFILNSSLPLRLKKEKLANIDKPSYSTLEIVDDNSYFYGDESSTVFFKDHSKAESYMVLKKDLQMEKPYAVKYEAKDFDWEINKKEKKKILGYDCYRAYYSDEGFEYAVWFAPELRYADGPYRFLGLDGLILELETKVMVITATSIESNAVLSQPLPSDFQYVKRGFLGSRLMESRN